jgi:hypothetical protein
VLEGFALGPVSGEGAPSPVPPAARQRTFSAKATALVENIGQRNGRRERRSGPKDEDDEAYEADKAGRRSVGGGGGA